ncbi:DUF4129 domain-containing protein [Microbacterium gorillae]|uniref:DUF4129 domain-containing protein n=1 Tax=Microbacterium gorillae TaxID=1231063 RepID=UPI00069346B0|nr:DUF4129 domain-containing protein [Microbacterium gorillae]
MTDLQAPARETPRTPRRPALGPLLAAGALFCLIMVAAVFQGPVTFGPLRLPGLTPSGMPPQTEGADDTPIPLPTDAQPGNLRGLGVVLAIIFGLVLTAIVVLLVIALVRWLRRLWNDRRLRARAGADVAADLVGAAVPAVDAPTVRRGVAAALLGLDERAEPGDAVVAAWVGLEESAADAGITRAPSETAAELAMRIVARDANSREAAQVLLGLYEAVRFGGHRAGEAERERARSALRRIEESWR